MAAKRRILSLLTAAIMSGLAGCGGGSTFNVQNPVAPPGSAPAITFQSTPAGSILINGTETLTAVVSNDESDAGVDWTVTCSNKGNCGSLSAAHTDSNAPVIYTPPDSLSGNSQSVDVVAFATADHTQNIVAPITINAFGNNLQGTYILQAQGVDNNGGLNYQYVGAIVFDGKGGITRGEQTINFLDLDPNINAFVSKTDTITGGSYFLGPDGRGTITFNTNDNGIGGNGIESFAFLYLSSSHAFITQFDFAVTGTPQAEIPNTGVSASGTMDLQDPGAITSAPSGGYAFAVSGSDLNGLGPTAIGGVLNIDSLNTISGKGSTADQILPGSFLAPTSAKPLGSISNPDSFGAVTLTLSVPNFQSTEAFTFTGYIVDAIHIALIESESAGVSGTCVSGGCMGSTAGLAIAQGSATGTFTSFSGTYVFGILGQDLSSTFPSTATSVGVFTAVDNGDGTGTLQNGFTDTFLQAYLDPNTGLPDGQIRATFQGNYSDAPAGSGRTRSFPAAFSPPLAGGLHPEYIFYQTGSGNPALVIATANNDLGVANGGALFVGAGIAYPQSTGALTFAGDYGFGFTQQNGSENDGIASVTAVPPAPNSNSGSLSGVADSTSDVPTDTTPGIHSFSGAFLPYNPSNTNGCSNSPSVNVTGCFASTISTGTAFSIPLSPLPLDSYIIDQNHGFLVETDLVDPNNPSGQVSFGYYATQTLPVPPSNSSSRRRRR